MRILICTFAVLIPTARAASANEIPVRTVGELREVVRKAQSGDRIRLQPGVYAGPFYFDNLHGKPGKPIVISAADPRRPPEISGGMLFSEVSHLELHMLTIRGAKGNGINIDDGGSYETPSHHVTLRGIRILDSGAGGNQDGIKLSGVDDFLIEASEVNGWSAGGSGIDMVGCHRGRIERSQFRRGGGNAVQAKGGSSDITVRQCRFEDHGQRGINIGGSTGMAYFRPPVRSMPPNGKYEAKNVRVENCVFVGGTAPIAFVGVDGATVQRCTFYRPSRWVIRILQETQDAGFVPSRKGVFQENIVVFRSTDWSEGGVNIGPGTAPRTFRFARNLWYCEDRPDRSRPNLPTPESGGIYGKDPLFRNPQAGDFTPKPASPAKGLGNSDAVPRKQRIW